MPSSTPGCAVARAGKYLTFNLGKEVYGLEILKVQEIIGMIPTPGSRGRRLTSAGSSTSAGRSSRWWTCG